MNRIAIALILVCAGLPASHAWAVLTFTDFTTTDTVGNTSSASLGPVAVTFSGTDISGGVTDNSFTGFNNAFFAPPLASSDSVHFSTNSSLSNYTITFSQPVTDPRLHLLSFASVLNFGAIPLTKLSGQETFVVAGSTVTGAANDFTTPTDANGTVQLTGTFTSVNFTATFPPGNDEIVMQIGADVVPEPSAVCALSLATAFAGIRRRRPR